MKFKYIILSILFFNQSAKGAENLFLYKGTFSRSIKIEELSKFNLTKKPSNKLKNLINDFLIKITIYLSIYEIH